jgi:hypothetical protein
VILVIHVYGVDVEVVVGLEIRLLEADVLQAVPLEEHLSGLDVDLLDYPVEHNTVYRIAHRNEVLGHLVVVVISAASSGVMRNSWWSPS